MAYLVFRIIALCQIKPSKNHFYVKLFHKLIGRRHDLSIIQVFEGEESDGESWGLTLFEPSPEVVFNALVPRMLRSSLRQACLDAVASEPEAPPTKQEIKQRSSRMIVVRGVCDNHNLF